MSEENKVPITVAPAFKRERIFLDKHGNRTEGLKGKVIKKVQEDEQPLPADKPAMPQAQSEAATVVPRTIEKPVEELTLKELQNKINDTEDMLTKLKLLKREKIQKLRAELEEMEASE